MFQPDRHDRMEIIITHNNNANLIVERLRYTEFFLSYSISTLVIMNADDIELILKEIQIRPSIRDLADWLLRLA